MTTTWPEVSLGETCTFQNGGTPSKKITAYFGGEIPWLTGADIDGTSAGACRTFLTDAGIKASPACVVPEGTILLVTRTGVGKVAIAQRSLSFSQDITALTPNTSRLDCRYLLRFLQTEADRFKAESRGATIKGITREVVASTKIPLPPLGEQRRIAAILDKADEVRSKRKAALKTLEALSQTIFIEMFGDPMANLSSRPMTTLGSAVTFVGGGTPSRAVPEYFDGEICWATSKDMKHSILVDTQEHITQRAVAESATNLVPAGTVLVVVKSKVLAHSLPVAIAKTPTCFGQDIKGLQAKSGWNADFVASSLKISQNWLLRQARGANTEGLTLQHLRSLPIVDASPDQQTRFSEAVEAVRTLAKSMGQGPEELFSSLQQNAFQGAL